jgi:uncharacterized protein YbbC (DUF1343 family)
MSKVLSGLDVLQADNSLQKKFTGKIGYLCHSASVNKDLRHGLEVMLDIFGDQVIKVFGPQHGFVTDVQDNMIESTHYTHPYFKLPVYSLYSETRVPTDEMLAGIDHLFVDLQDVGTRIYTYIYTLTLLLEKCAGKDIEIVVLDRPNPIDADTVEGNVLEAGYETFVGRHPMPVRHGLTIAEVAKMHQLFWHDEKCHLNLICMHGYHRKMSFEDTGLPWVMPSPNLPTIDGCYPFVGTVLFEGTNISEGRGTTRSLEIVGHPDLEPWSYKKHLDEVMQKANLEGFFLRPLNFQPTFQKHAGVGCGGFQIHVLDRAIFKPWRVCQLLCREFKQQLGDKFQYKQDPYEYEYDKNPVDMINGTDKLRHWYENNGTYAELEAMESSTLPAYLDLRSQALLY